jgi:hypothetical protein
MNDEKVGSNVGFFRVEFGTKLKLYRSRFFMRIQKHREANGHVPPQSERLVILYINAVK